MTHDELLVSLRNNYTVANTFCSDTYRIHYKTRYPKLSYSVLGYRYVTNYQDIRTALRI